MLTKNNWDLLSLDQDIIIGKNELHIWRVKVSENIANLYEYWNILDWQEKDQAKLFYFAEDRSRYIITRAVLRKLLAKYLCNITPEKIQFAQTDNKKPYLSDHINIKNIKFNLSHSKDVIIYAFTSEIEIGVDIEYINKDLQMDDITKYCFSEQEKIKFKNLTNGQKNYYFYKIWVIKEAVVKAMGLGLTFDLKQINICFNKNKLLPIVYLNKNKLLWTFKIFYAYNDYCGAFVAKESNLEKVVFLEFKI